MYITQLIHSYGTKLMNLQQINDKFSKNTIIMKKIHQKLQIFFCKPLCTLECQHNYQQYKLPFTLLPQFILPQIDTHISPTAQNNKIIPNGPSFKIWKQIKTHLLTKYLHVALSLKKSTLTSIVFTIYTYANGQHKTTHPIKKWQI